VKENFVFCLPADNYLPPRPQGYTFRVIFNSGLYVTLSGFRLLAYLDTVLPPVPTTTTPRTTTTITTTRTTARTITTTITTPPPGRFHFKLQTFSLFYVLVGFEVKHGISAL